VSYLLERRERTWGVAGSAVRSARAVIAWIAYKIPEDRSEIPGLSVWDATSTDAMSMAAWDGTGGLSTSGPRLAPRHRLLDFLRATGSLSGLSVCYPSDYRSSTTPLQLRNESRNCSWVAAVACNRGGGAARGPVPNGSVERGSSPSRSGKPLVASRPRLQATAATHQIHL